MTTSTPWRPQPPSISDPKVGEMALKEMGVEIDELAPSLDNDGESTTVDPNWIKRAKEAYDFSTTYFDSNFRKQMENSLRAFNNQHPMDSKYNSPVFSKRSNIFRPKTRSVIRKNEAAGAAAFFSNLDRVSVQGANMGDAKDRVSADVMKELLQYRLTKSIPWFQICQGGLQDAQVQAFVIAHCHWRYIQDKKGRIQQDQPVVDLIPGENFRFDPASSWLDPVNTSPYVIHMIPMYVCDIHERMEQPDPKGRTWFYYSNEKLRRGVKNDDDSTRQTRIGLQQDPTRESRTISDYDICWVHRHIHRWEGQDWEFYTLASEFLLTEPEPLKQTVFHGKRPYVLGVSILETHKPMPASVPKLIEGVQEEINEVTNQRLDNVKFVLNKKWFIKRGKNVDIPRLMANTPGQAILMDDPEKDVIAQEFSDVTASSYQEQERLDAMLDELAGNFSAAQVQQQRSPRESEGTMRLLQSPASVLTEYLLKTYVETFVQPVLRQLVLLEQHYETDVVVMALAGKKSEVFQKYGQGEVTDEILDRELTVNVNVGMGATDPTTRLQRLAMGLSVIGGVTKLPPPGINLSELWKEIFALSGYQDGERFMQEDPQIAMLKKQIMVLGQTLGQKVRNKETAEATKLQVGREKNRTTLIAKAMEHDTQKRLALVKHVSASGESDKQAALQMAQPAAEAAKPKDDGQSKQMLKALADGQQQMVEAIVGLATLIKHQVSQKPKPKTRKGKAQLPSGGEMLFEMTDTEH